VALAGPLVLVASGAIGAGAYVAWAASRRPAGSIRDFHAQGGHCTGRGVAVILGSSTIQGRMGVDAIPIVRDRLPGWQVINAGHNGDSAADLLARVDEVVGCEPDAVAIHPGGFDAFRRRPVAGFKASLQELIERLQQTRARVGLISLHANGDDLSTEFSRRVTLYNDAIREVAATCRADYLPLRERMAAELEAEPRGARWNGQIWMAPAAAVQRYLLGRSFDEISRRNGFRFNVDGVHLNSQGAVLLADVITEFLERVSVEGAIK